MIPVSIFDHDAIKEKTIKGGWVTYVGKGCTEYGIAYTATTLAGYVLRDEKHIMATSAPLRGEYGEDGIFAGVPAVVGENGVEKVVELSLTDTEKKEFKTCCTAIRENIKKCRIHLEKMPNEGNEKMLSPKKGDSFFMSLA